MRKCENSAQIFKLIENILLKHPDLIKEGKELMKEFINSFDSFI